jgi:hypothetical protein
MSEPPKVSKAEKAAAKQEKKEKKRKAAEDNAGARRHMHGQFGHLHRASLLNRGPPTCRNPSRP